MRAVRVMISVFFTLLFISPAYCGFFDWLPKKIKSPTSVKISDTKIGQGLKEALRVGIENTIKATSAENGFFANPAIKILLPENIKKVETFLRSVGFGPQVDQFVLSMNRAAENAVPMASDIFAQTLTDMTIDDATRLLNSGNGAATEYFKKKTYEKLQAGFMPLVKNSMERYEVTKKFEDIMTKVKTIPFAKDYIDIDISKYVTTKALDGVFMVLEQEENKIRTDPAARVNDILRSVFK